MTKLANWPLDHAPRDSRMSGAAIDVSWRVAAQNWMASQEPLL